MIEFSEAFFQVLRKELSSEEQHLLQAKLKLIYGGVGPHRYEDLQDFKICKAQLLSLLVYIKNLDANKLELFALYEKRVGQLTEESSKSDIEVTLKSAKRSIESALLIIESNHPKVDKTILDKYIVTLCYAGAAGNLRMVLDHFWPSELLFCVDNAKQKLLLQLATSFSNEFLPVYVISEIHRSYTFFNFLAQAYGLSPQPDPSVLELHEELLKQFALYVEKHFTVAAFIHTLKSCLPAIPQQGICTNKDLQQLDDFFQALGEANPPKSQYLQLFEEMDSDDFAVVPRSSFDIYYSSFLVVALEKAGFLSFIKGVDFSVGTRDFFDNGEDVVAIVKGRFECLPENSVLPLMQEPSLAREHRLHLSRRLSPEPLFNLYQVSADDEKAYYFSLLLEKIKLPLFMVEILVEDSHNILDKKQQAKLANYVFQEEYNLLEEKLKLLAQCLTPKQELRYFHQAIQKNILTYVNLFLEKNPSLAYESDDALGRTALFYAAAKGRVAIISQLAALGVDINQATDDFRSYFDDEEDDVKARLEEKINSKLDRGYSEDAIPFSPIDVAYVRGNDEILALLQITEKNNGIRSHSEHISFSFFFIRDKLVKPETLTPDQIGHKIKRVKA